MRGWRYRIQTDGYVKLGTQARWSFRLTSYDDYSNPEACIRAEMQRLAKGPGPEHGRSRSPSRSHSRSSSRSPDLLGLEHDLLGECSAFVARDAACEPDARRKRVPTQPYSPSKGWGEYERGRSGTRNVRTRDVTCEL